MEEVSKEGGGRQRWFGRQRSVGSRLCPSNGRRSAMSAARKWLWPVLICAATSMLLFPRLGQRSLWEDEAGTALGARAVLAWGVPKVYNETRLSSYAFVNGNRHLVDSLVPWAQYYIVAAFFRALGQDAWTARFPFALAGLACVGCLYVVTLRWFRDELTAALAALLCGSSVSFLLFSRQCRYFALAMLLTLLVVQAYLHLNISRKRSILLFWLVGTLLFYSHHIACVSLLVSLAVCSLVIKRSKEKVLGLLVAAGAVAASALPWFALAAGKTVLFRPALRQRLWETGRLICWYLRDYCALGLFPVLLLPLLVFVWVRRPELRTALSTLLIIVIVSTLVTSAISPQIGHPETTDRAFVRYQIGLLPLGAVLVAVCCAALAKYSRAATAVVVLLLLGTNLLGWPLNPLWAPAAGDQYSYHRWSPILNYLHEITHDVREPAGVIAAYLNERSQPGEQAVCVRTYLGDILSFHTELVFYRPRTGTDPPSSREILLWNRVPDHLWLIYPNRLRWVVDIDNAFQSASHVSQVLGLRAAFEPVHLDVVTDLELNRPEIWYHAFSSVRPAEGSRGAIIYEKRQ